MLGYWCDCHTPEVVLHTPSSTDHDRGEATQHDGTMQCTCAGAGVQEV